jgi:hypothetical protein
VHVETIGGYKPGTAESLGPRGNAKASLERYRQGEQIFVVMLWNALDVLIMRSLENFCARMLRLSLLTRKCLGPSIFVWHLHVSGCSSWKGGTCSAFLI